MLHAAHQAQQALSTDPTAGAKLLEMADGNALEISAKLAAEAYKKGDALAKRLVEKAGEVLVPGMVSRVNAFNPCRLILGGGVIDGLPELVERVKREVGEKALASTGAQKNGVGKNIVRPTSTKIRDKILPDYQTGTDTGFEP